MITPPYLRVYPFVLYVIDYVLALWSDDIVLLLFPDAKTPMSDLDMRGVSMVEMGAGIITMGVVNKGQHVHRDILTYIN